MSFSRSVLTRLVLFILVLVVVLPSCSLPVENRERKRPNILFALVEDVSYPHMGAYGTDWVKTPAFDRVVEQGVLFENAYTSNAKCGPSRSILLTGRHSWQLEEAANHFSVFPPKFSVFTEVLSNRGYDVAYTGKGWGPGRAKTRDGERRHLTGAATPAESYSRAFRKFLLRRDSEEPFFFWYGAHEAHRGYTYKSGIKQGGKKRSDIDVVPSFLPDTKTVRTDLLDYALEIERFDHHLSRMLTLLKKHGELENTMVVVTADHGMPFPRAKGQAYEMSNHVPLAIMWPGAVENAGRVIQDYVDFTDLAPTFLDAAGVQWEDTEMHSTPGASLLPILESTGSGRVQNGRDHVLVGKERHDIGRPNDHGYPIRGIVQDGWLYLRNFKPDRWPAGPPVTGYPNVDGSPTKTEILGMRDSKTMRRYWEWSFGKRPPEELYHLERDPGCVVNLADDPAYDGVRNRLKKRLFQELKKQEDPRMSGNGDVFDNYPYSNSRMRNFYEKYLRGDLTKQATGWLNPSDYAERSEKTENSSR